MEPRIQYAQTKDGVSIAFWTMGEGTRTLVSLGATPYTNVQAEWDLPRYRERLELLAHGRRLVRLDNRGSGMSSRDVPVYSFDSLILDLEAVVGRLDVPQFALLGFSSSCRWALLYASKHPEQLSHLILVDPYVRASELYDLPQAKGLMGLIENDWETYTETIASVGFGWEAGEPARAYASFLRQCVTADLAKSFIDADRLLDLTGILPKITAPTLVIHRKGVPFPTMEGARSAAALIPGARMTLLEGAWMQQGATSRKFADVVDEFLREGEEAEAKTGLPEGMAVILFADIVDSTALTEQLGDAAFREKAAELDASLRTAIRESNGLAVEGKLVGDGLMAVFTSARQAIEAALRCGEAGDECGLPLHLGVHAGDVIREGNNVYGGAVNIAARIASASAPGEVLVSDTVRGLARTSAGVAFDDRGEHSLKGVADPQRLYAVRGGA